MFGFGDDVIERSAAFGAADVGHDTVGAVLVAAAHDAEVGHEGGVAGNRSRAR